MATTTLAHEKVWIEKPQYDKAARLHYETVAKVVTEKLLEQQRLITNEPEEPFVAVNSTKKQKLNTTKKSKEKNIEIRKRQKSLKKSLLVVADTTPCDEQINVAQESQQSICPIIPASGSLANEIAKARQHIKKSLQCMNGIAACTDVSLQDVVARVAFLENDSKELRNTVQELKGIVKQLETKLAACQVPSLQICPAKPDVAVPAAPTKADEAEDDVDLFGSDSEGEDAEAAKIREERLAAYAAKKSKKPVLIAKSNIILDVKPWDDETDMKVMETEVRKITCDGLLWGAAKLVPLAYGIHKLQISCVVEDEKVSVDWLTDAIQEIEDYVQSVDIAAFNKV